MGSLPPSHLQYDGSLPFYLESLLASLCFQGCYQMYTIVCDSKSDNSSYYPQINDYSKQQTSILRELLTKIFTDSLQGQLVTTPCIQAAKAFLLQKIPVTFSFESLSHFCCLQKVFDIQQRKSPQGTEVSSLCPMKFHLGCKVTKIAISLLLYLSLGKTLVGFRLQARLSTATTVRIGTAMTKSHTGTLGQQNQ